MKSGHTTLQDEPRHCLESWGVVHPVSRRHSSEIRYLKAETCCLYEDDRRIGATEMDGLRISARISKLDRKTNDYIREKMNKQDTI